MCTTSVDIKAFSFVAVKPYTESVNAVITTITLFGPLSNYLSKYAASVFAAVR